LNQITIPIIYHLEVFGTMTTFDVFCTLAIIDEREAEIAAEAAKKANIKDTIAMTMATTSSIANPNSNSGDSAKGAKLFQVSFFPFFSPCGCYLLNQKLIETSDSLRSVPHCRSWWSPQGRPQPERSLWP